MTHTGTYNNQYMVIDLKKVTLGRELANGTLWVVEQIPGLVVADDQTTILRAGQFAERIVLSKFCRLVTLAFC